MEAFRREVGLFWFGLAPKLKRIGII
ncbi:uncharacterized protein METZ01_LOCUS437395 [marine metagenome]|uniref:Uncharacterized protein n=1 Tax=marine metagenome TaxID=408172 RepID=A0A382YNE9_9ZZZZ